MKNKGISYLFNTSDGKKELKEMINNNLPKVINKRKSNGFYSTDIIYAQSVSESKEEYK